MSDGEDMMYEGSPIQGDDRYTDPNDYRTQEDEDRSVHAIWPFGPACECGQPESSSYHEGWADGTERARAALIDELVAAVKALPKWDKRSVPGGFHVNRAAVLGLLEGARHGK